MAADDQRKLPLGLCKIVSPLRTEKWAEWLAGHPDQAFAGYILRGLQQGFRVGFNPGLCKLKARPMNMTSRDEHPEVVAAYLEAEVAHGRLVPLEVGQADALGIHTSPFGVIPKKGKPNRWRLILDLSSPHGHSVNDGISKDLSSFCYVSVDRVVNRVLELGKASWLAKMDVKQAYRNIAVHPADRYLLGMKWEGRTYVDATLPFGLRSAPLIFSAVADMLAWFMQVQGASWLAHYVDDFITVGAPQSMECGRNVEVMHAVCEEVGMPVEPEKDEGPATTITFLGLEIDSIALEVRLPQEKLQSLKALLGSWRGRKACRKRDLLSLIGSLTHACRAVRPGRSYLRRLIDLSTMAKRLDQFVRLNRDARADLEWWNVFMGEWNGTAMMLADPCKNPQIILTSDASGNWGCGAHTGDQWFMLPWMGTIRNAHITVKELAPVVIASLLWGREWRGKAVLVYCDNSAVVGIINSGVSKNPLAMQLRRCLAFIAATRDLNIRAVHIRGASNMAADALSRDNLARFRTCCPQAQLQGTPVPSDILDALLLREPDWLAREWIEMWSSTVARP